MVAEKVFAVIAESTRRDILEALAQDSKAVGQLVDELGVSQPTVSKHLRVLREAGVVTMRAQGQKRFYGINTEPLALVSTWLDSLGAGITEGSDGIGAPAPAARVVTEIAEPASVAAKEAVVKPAARVASAAAPAVASKSAAAPTSAKTEPSVASPGSASPAAAVAVPPGATPARTAPAQTASTVVRQPAIVGMGADSDGGVPRQLGRSVGRAAKKGADLLATFKRRKD